MRLHTGFVIGVGVIVVGFFAAILFAGAGYMSLRATISSIAACRGLMVAGVPRTCQFVTVTNPGVA